MSTEDFAQTSREALIALILEQHATIVALQERISILEKRLTERAGPGMPGNKPAAATDRRLGPVSTEPWNESSLPAS